ncbi:MAG: EAL domain-containing protein [Candidatus Thiodiazotropha sp.]
MMYNQTKRHVELDMLNTAEKIRGTLMAMRRVYHHQFLDSGLPLTDKTIGFLPAHALNKISKDFANWETSGFSFNNVSDLPRNPSQLADAVELEAILDFRAHPDKKIRLVRFTDANDKPFFHYSRPIWVEAYCLKCHGDKAAAPETIQAKYDSAYNYEVGDLRGILSIKMPANEVDERVAQLFKRQLFWSIVLLALLALAVLWMVNKNVITPIRKLQKSIDEAWTNEPGRSIPVLPGEFKTVSQAFNTMVENVEAKQADLIKTTATLEAVVNSTSVAIAWANESGVIEYINPQFISMFGYTLNDISTVEDWFLKAYPDENYRNAVVSEWNKKVELSLPERKAIGQMEVYINCKDGSQKYTLLHGSWAGSLLIAAFTDITEQKDQQDQVEYIANHDTLTGLPNRTLLADRLNLHMSQANRRNQQLAVIYLDLDGFKDINDTHGHEVGDYVLVVTAQKLKAATRESDTVSRIGGDEFVIVITDLSNIEECLPMLQRILNAANQPVQYKSFELNTSCSIGVSFYPQPTAVDGDQLIRQADQAMYHAKLAGKNRFHVFDSEHDRNLRGFHKNIENLQQALQNNEFLLVYQPIINMRTGQVNSVEALLRWRDSEGRLLTPGMFLPAIENHPLAVTIGKWVLHQALADMDTWHGSGIDISVNINVFARQLLEPDFAENIAAAVTQHKDLDIRRIELEILESTALHDLTKVSEVITACKEFGISFALDDFGTGYSSLTYLKHLPADTLKIDQSFVRDMLVDHDDLAIIEGTLGLAKAFRRQVIAEGVEDIQQGTILIQLGCELAQGYCIAHPMPAREITDWIASWLPEPIWKIQHPYPYERIPILYAATEHRAWINQVERYVQGYDKTIPIMDDSQCRFGKWLDSEADEYFNGTTYTELVSLHQAIHQLANQILERHKTGEQSGAEATLTELYLLRNKLIDQLEKSVETNST